MSQYLGCPPRHGISRGWRGGAVSDVVPEDGRTVPRDVEGAVAILPGAGPVLRRRRTGLVVDDDGGEARGTIGGGGGAPPPPPIHRISSPVLPFLDESTAAEEAARAAAVSAAPVRPGDAPDHEEREDRDGDEAEEEDRDGKPPPPRSRRIGTTTAWHPPPPKGGGRRGYRGQAAPRAAAAVGDPPHCRPLSSRRRCAAMLQVDVAEHHVVGAGDDSSAMGRMEWNDMMCVCGEETAFGGKEFKNTKSKKQKTTQPIHPNTHIRVPYQHHKKRKPTKRGE